MRNSLTNVDETVAAGFGREWSTFQQDEGNFSASDREAMFDSYFDIFPWEALPPEPVGIDVGCGSGRWSVLVAPRVGHLHLLDASADALAVAQGNLSGASNTTFHLASVGDIPLQDGSLDFAFSLGVLHHVPDTLSAIEEVASKLRRGAPFLVYLYYAFDNRPWWFRTIWKLSNVFRVVICRLPASLRLVISQIIAATIYWPLARTAALAQRAGLSTALIPLEYYRHRSFYVMRTDAYDRFCTRLEKRFTRRQIERMLEAAGFEKIRFSEQVPFWCAVGLKR
jgi:ubiquinone/menaquinone biosynthesis C-methylase UbiE